MSIDVIQRQSIVSFVGQIALKFIGLLSTMYIAHVVGPGILGEYFVFIAYLSIIGLVTDGGFGGAAVKRISEGEEQDEYFSAFVVLRFVFVMVVVFVLIAFRSYFIDLNNGTLIWFLLALIASFFGGAFSSGMQGCGKIGISATASFIENVSRIIFQVVVVFLGYGFGGLAGGFVAGIIVGSIVLLHFFDLHFVRFGWKHIKSLSRFSLWIFLISGGMIVFSTTDIVMIRYYLNKADVGVYSIVLQFAAFAAFSTIALNSTLYPKISRWGKIGETELIEKTLSRVFTYSFVLAMPIFAGGVLLGDKLLYYFYGAEFERGYMTMVVLLIVQIVNIFQYSFLTYLIALDYLKDLFKITAVAVALNIALNAALIPAIGITGAAVATLVTMVFNAFLAMRLLSKKVTIRMEVGSLLNILTAALVMSFLVGGYRMFVPLSNVWLALVPVVLGAVVYVGLVLKFDMKIFKELKKIMTLNK